MTSGDDELGYVVIKRPVGTFAVVFFDRELWKLLAADMADLASTYTPREIEALKGLPRLMAHRVDEVKRILGGSLVLGEQQA